MSKRRLDWLRQIVQSPEDNVQLKAAVFGTLDIVAGVEIGWNPWVQQWERDLDELAQATNNIEQHEAIKNTGRKDKYCSTVDMQWFVQQGVQTSTVLQTVENGYP